MTVEAGSPLSRLVLTGFMGAGKSTVGAILARKLAWDFLDLDAVIEARNHLTVAQIFRDHGEARFRELEREAVQQLVQREHMVLALGGGTIIDGSSRSLLIHSPGTCLVFLDGKLTELVARCVAEGKARPLLGEPEVVQARLTSRLPFYRMAHITVTTTGLEPQQVAAQVLEETSARWRLKASHQAIAQ